MAAVLGPVIRQVDAIDFGTITVSPAQFAALLQKYVWEGSKRHRLVKDDIHVFFNIEGDFAGKETVDIIEMDNKKVSNNLVGLMSAGAKFMDAAFWLALPKDERPTPEDHPAAKPGQKQDFSTFNNHEEIAKCMFFYFFYLLTRARAPGGEGSKEGQPVPQFLRTILSIKKSPTEVAEYLGSFDLEKIDPSWIKHINLKGLSQEALNRFGLGVAGYRMSAPFKLCKPDAPGHDTYIDAINVAKSFATTDACWSFHPSTRTPDLLTKYGNINQNLANLLLVTYKKETLEQLVTIRTLYAMPTPNPNHTNYTEWTDSMRYVTKERIFPLPTKGATSTT